MDARALAVLTEAVEFELAVGYPTREEVVELACDRVGDELPDLDAGQLRAEAKRIVRERLEAQRDAEATWPPTDHDRLVAVFERLEGSGIVCREDYGATFKDAAAQIRDEAARLVASGRRVRGVCVFERQDAETAAHEGLLYLGFGAAGAGGGGGAAGAAAIATEICAALGAVGFDVEWDGDAEERIVVRVPNWRVRRFTGRPDRPSMRGWTRVWRYGAGG
jgi:hypothetical protein